MRFILLLSLFLAFSQITQADEVLQKEDPAWIDETMEDMVTPLKQWLEYNEQTQQPAPKPAQITMRQAIKQATRQYPGVVLSVKQQDKAYQIKILSKQGVVKLINISTFMQQVPNENTDH